MDAKTLIAKALEQREAWVDLGDGKRVAVRRPPEAEFPELRSATPERFLRCVVKWEGFTEADILGAAVGAADPVPFNAELWMVLALDRVAWVSAVVEKVVAQINEFYATEERVSGN